MKTFLGAFVFVFVGVSFLNKSNPGFYPLCSMNKDTYIAFDTVPKNRQDSSIRLRDDSINRYRRDTFNRKDSFIRKKDSLQ
jgi:hypothetical protein